MHIHLIAGRKGGAGRSLTSILLGLGLAKLEREVAILHVRRARADPLFDGGLGAPFRSLACPLGVSPWQSALASRTGLHHVPDLRLVRDMARCDHLVVDWTSDDPADVPGLLAAASSVLVPVLPDAIMIDAAARSWLALDDHLMGAYGRPRPRLVMIGAAEPRYDPPHRSAMEEVLGGYNADEDHDTTNALLDHALPRLGEACLLDLLHERDWWRHDGIGDAAMAVAAEILDDSGGNPPGGRIHPDVPDNVREVLKAAAMSVAAIRAGRQSRWRQSGRARSGECRARHRLVCGGAYRTAPRETPPAEQPEATIRQNR
jgi:hypothetical protein